MAISESHKNINSSQIYRQTGYWKLLQMVPEWDIKKLRHVYMVEGDIYLFRHTLEGGGVVWFVGQLAERGGLRGRVECLAAARGAARDAGLVGRALREVPGPGRRAAQVPTERRAPSTLCHLHITIQTEPSAEKNMFII